ncbi:hypothetical protein [Photobacterium kishitanii]|uniref:hypothetical protein n=1 Tax=Photobacterium kishitanii TaxID=318456 RepID=UPI0011B26EB9|nr:hypothetical protein [Photobacterium kishitanii]
MPGENDMLDRATLAITAGTGVGVGIGATKSAENAQSMLNSSFEQILSGHFTWYGSDIITVVGIGLSIVGIVVTVYRIKLERRRKYAL